MKMNILMSSSYEVPGAKQEFFSSRKCQKGHQKSSFIIIGHQIEGFKKNRVSINLESAANDLTSTIKKVLKRVKSP